MYLDLGNNNSTTNIILYFKEKLRYNYYLIFHLYYSHFHKKTRTFTNNLMLDQAYYILHNHV